MPPHSNHEHWKEFNKNELSHSAAHYLMAIHDLHQEQGYARLIDVSNHLNLSKGSLFTSLKPLIKKNFVIEDKNKHLSLSPKGQAFVDHINKSYQSFFDLLTKVLNIDPEAAEIDACKVEHLFSGQTTHAIHSLVQALELNPELQKNLHKALTKEASQEPCETSQQLPISNE